MACPMGEAKLDLTGSICPPFGRSLRTDRRLKLEFHGNDISSDGILFPYRELDHALELTEPRGAAHARRARTRSRVCPGSRGAPSHPEWSVGWFFDRQIGLTRGGNEPFTLALDVGLLMAEGVL